MMCCSYVFFFFKQTPAYEMRISDWSSDVCSSGLGESLRGYRKQLRGDQMGTEDGSSAGVCSATHGRDKDRWRCAVVARDRVRGGGCAGRCADRKSVVWGKGVSVRVDLGGRRIINKKNKTRNENAAIWSDI